MMRITPDGVRGTPPGRHEKREYVQGGSTIASNGGKENGTPIGF